MLYLSVRAASQAACISEHLSSKHGGNSPSNGTASDVGGDISETIDKKKQMDSSTVISEKYDF